MLEPFALNSWPEILITVICISLIAIYAYIIGREDGKSQ